MSIAANKREIVSIIIPVYNRVDDLEKCLLSLIDARKFLNSTNIESEVIIVNDGGKKSQEIRTLSGRHPKTVYIQLGNRAGAARAKNIGAKHAKGDYLLFMDSDTESVNPQFIKNMVVYLKNNSRFGIVGGEFKRVGNEGGWSVPKRHFSKKGAIIIEEAVDEAVVETEWISSSNLMIEQSLFFKLGGYFEKMFYLYEDAELCAAARGLGYAIGTAPVFAVKHNKSSCGRNDIISFFLSERNKYLYVYMHANLGLLLRTIAGSFSNFGVGKRYVLIIPSLLSFIVLAPYAFLRKKKLNKIKADKNNVWNS